MNSIKFNHIYSKMPDNVKNKETTEAVLLEVFSVDKIEELSDCFIEYDTKIDNHLPRYKLPINIKVLVLILSSPDIWTTIRRYTPDKEKHYRSIRGQSLKLIFTEI